MAYHAGRRAERHRVLPDQPADQGLQRPGLRLRRQPVRRLPGQQPGRAVRRLRLLVRADDGRGGARDRLGARPGLPQADPPARGDHLRARGASCTPPSGRPAARSTPAAGHDYRTHDVEMHISEIGLCSGHSSSGVWVDEHAATTVPGLYAAGDLACVPHNYMIGAFVFGDLAGADAARAARQHGPLRAGGPERAVLPEDQVAAAHELIYRPLRHPTGRRSRRSSTSCAASSTTTWRRPRPRPSWPSRSRPSSG